MALTQCPECNNKISDKAGNCPHCGIPIATAADTHATGTPLTTIQETAKRFKVQLLGAWALFIIGIIMAFQLVDTVKAGGEASPIPGLMVFGGLGWWVVTKFRIWWHHK